MPIWYTHNIKNIGKEDLITLFWINEAYDPNNPDTYIEKCNFNVMKKLKVVTVVGTRPEIIRLSAIIKRLNDSNSIDHFLIHTGQNYDKELNEIFFEDLNLKIPDFYLNAATDNPSSTIGNILTSIHPILKS